MLKKFIKLVKKIVFAAITLYGYNIVTAPLNLQIPINFVTLGLVSLLGIPSLIGLILNLRMNQSIKKF